jgi:hypothetical protein
MKTQLEGWFFLGWGVEYDIEHCHFVSYFLPNLQLNIGKKYLKTAIIIDESLIHAIVSHKYKNVLILRAFFIIGKLHNLKIHFVPFSYMYINSKCHTESNKMTMIYSSYYMTLNGHPKDSIVLRRARHHLLHALLSSLIFTCKNYLDWDIFRYFYFFTKYI